MFREASSIWITPAFARMLALLTRNMLIVSTQRPPYVHYEDDTSLLVSPVVAGRRPPRRTNGATVTVPFLTHVHYASPLSLKTRLWGVLWYGDGLVVSRQWSWLSLYRRGSTLCAWAAKARFTVLQASSTSVSWVS